MKQAILVVSFGTTHLDTLEQNITPLEQTVARAFPDAALFRAFTSPVIRRLLERRHGMKVPGVEEAVEQILSQGYEALTVQPALLIPGGEYDRLISELQPFKNRIPIRLGLPLLWQEQDLDTLIEIVKENYRVPEDTVLLLMGHGTEHSANRFYIDLAEKVKQQRECCMRLCTVDAEPTFWQVVEELQQGKLQKVTAVPLMLVAGDHAKNDMMGDDPESLCSVLKEAGFSVECRVEGLGQLEKIRSLYRRRAVEAAPL